MALSIGAVEAAGLIAERFGLQGAAWSLPDRIAQRFNLMGMVIIGLFAAGWLASLALARRRAAERP